LPTLDVILSTAKNLGFILSETLHSVQGDNKSMARTPDEPDIVPPPIITLLTDFGAADVFVGSMKGVILGINPHAKIIDLTHDIPAHNIRAGAYLLPSASRPLPPGPTHLPSVARGRPSPALPPE